MRLIRQHFKSIDSTNTWAKKHAHLLSQDAMTLVTAHEQTAGRGRFKRRWESPPGENVLASFCFFVEKGRKDLGNIAQILALSTRYVLKMLGADPTLKWPNDVLVSGKKIAGILAETTLVEDRLCFVAGIGLNVNMSLECLQKIDRPATSLFVELGTSLDVELILEQLQSRFMLDLSSFLKEGFSPFLEEYRQLILSPSKKPIQFDDGRTIWEGMLEAINTDGSCVLKLKNGQVKTFVCGEILF